MNRLTGKRALITGGARGIGLAVCQALAREGATVAVADRLTDEAAKAADNIGDGAIAVTMDVTDPASIADAVATVERSLGGVDILVNNAGVFNMGPIEDITAEDYRRQFDVNVGGTIFVTQAVLPGMKRRAHDGGGGGGGASIINFASQAGRRGEARVAVYCATKAAVISLTQSFALELAPHGIRVNAIAPGVVDTPMWDIVDGLFARYENRELGQKKRLVGEAVPLGHMGCPAEIADPCVFLASSEARYITAQTLNVDGGNWMS